MDNADKNILREKKSRVEAMVARDAILIGYQDAIHGRTVRYTGDLREMLLSKVREVQQRTVVKE